jgi:hypothetical protein
MAGAHNAASVRRAVEEIGNRDQLDLADVLFAADYINHAGLIPDFVRGPEAITNSVALYRTVFPTCRPPSTLRAAVSATRPVRL